MLEPKTKATILVRPCYDENSELYKGEQRFIGMIYVNSKKCYESVDKDSEFAAFINCSKHIQWYQKKFNCSFFIDAYKGELKK